MMMMRMIFNLKILHQTELSFERKRQKLLAWPGLFGLEDGSQLGCDDKCLLLYVLTATVQEIGC
jgi:hypothetical protein